MEQLVLRYGGKPFVAPSVQEIPFSKNEELFQWATRLLAGEFDMLVLMTGVGLTYLRDALLVRYPQEQFVEALRKLTIVSRGPKPVAVLHELGLKSTIVIQEPNTWKEIVPVIAERPERRITIQEYGRRNPEFVGALEDLGAQVTTLEIYRWSLPEDLFLIYQPVPSRLPTSRLMLPEFLTTMTICFCMRCAKGKSVHGN